MSHTEPKQPQAKPWGEVDLPTLTDEAQGDPQGMDIPELVFPQDMEPPLAPPGQTEAPLEFPPELLLVDVPEAVADESAIDFNQLPSLDLTQESAAAPAGEHEFTFELEPLDGHTQPASALDVVLTDLQSPTPEMLAQTIPELSLDDLAVADQETVENEPVAQAIPELTLEDLAVADQETAESEPAAQAIPELTLEDLAVADQVAAESEAVAQAIPELTLADLAVADDVTAESDPAAQAIPELSLEGLAVADQIVAQSESVAPTASELMQTDLAMAEVDAPVSAEAGEAQEAGALSAMDLSADPTLATPAPLGAALSEATADEEVPDLSSLLADVALEPAVESVPAVEPSAVDDAGAQSAGADELVASEAMPMVDVSAERAAEADAGATEAGESFRSISLDSLPRGVLGGGMALANAEAEDNGPSVQDLIRAAERTLNEERRRQAVEVASVASVAEVAAVSAGVAQESARPVEIINVAGLASSPAPQSYNLSPARKPYVTLVDEAMLIDSLYDKILPRMKVELSLWLQDALDHQAKQMLSGVMHQLKEDYEMLFSETLRESLRQAIAEMGRADRGERF